LGYGIYAFSQIYICKKYICEKIPNDNVVVLIKLNLDNLNIFDLTNEERKGLKNIYVKYLPIEEKIRLKKVLEETSETIYCDNSIEEIL